MLDTINCIILCGGAGTRMGSAGTHKVCFEIGMRPAIKLAMENYRKAGIRKFILVVGHMCGQVVETVGSEYPDAVFVYQHNPRGTGHAARVAMDALENAGMVGPVLITMGDKIVHPSVIESLAEDFSAREPAVSFAVIPAQYAANAGRVVTFDGVTAIREAADIRQAMGQGAGGDSAGAPGTLTIGGREMDAFEIEKSARHVNASVYLFRRRALRGALKELSADNVQSEEYLTDVIEMLSGRGGVSAVEFTGRDAIMSFNNPEELLEIRDHYRNGVQTRPVGAAEINRVEDWLRLIGEPTPAFRRHLKSLYGDDSAFLKARRESTAKVLQLFARRYGADRRAVIARSPGRINLMGRHIDHRGGMVNVMSINKEVTMAASVRDDDVIRVVNTDRMFRPFEFSLSEHFKGVTWESWVGYLNSERVHRIVSQQRGSWANYVKAAALRLQYMLPDIKLRGMDVAMSGDIPIAAGLSSSSAVVVAATEAMITLNELDVAPERFVDLCGEGEWFVGSRGGSADHAAMKFARRGQVISMSFYPFEVVGRHGFPEGCRLIIANSGVKAEKSHEARNQFNHRVACYELGMLMLKRSYRIEHLRDLTPGNLDLPLDAIYRGLLKLPEVLRREEIGDYCPQPERAAAQRILETHSGIEEYPLRSVILYGLSECARARLCGELLERGDVEALGRYMVISHDGDRVSRRAADGGYVESVFRTDDRYLASLIEGANEEWARPEMQHGGYYCSTPEIDCMVDIACGGDGVHGAQLSGAGLGGCAMILADAGAVDEVLKRLREQYYAPRGLEPDMTVCSPVQGSGVLRYE